MLKHHHENMLLGSYSDMLNHVKPIKTSQNHAELRELRTSEAPLLNALEIDILELDLLSAQSLFPMSFRVLKLENLSSYIIRIITKYIHIYTNIH